MTGAAMCGAQNGIAFALEIIEEGEIDDRRYFVEYHFQSPDSHPYGVYKELGELYPNLLFNIEIFSFDNSYEGVIQMYNGAILA